MTKFSKKKWIHHHSLNFYQGGWGCGVVTWQYNEIESIYKVTSFLPVVRYHVHITDVYYRMVCLFIDQSQIQQTEYSSKWISKQLSRPRTDNFYTIHSLSYIIECICIHVLVVEFFCCFVEKTISSISKVRLIESFIITSVG